MFHKLSSDGHIKMFLQVGLVTLDICHTTFSCREFDLSKKSFTDSFGRL